MMVCVYGTVVLPMLLSVCRRITNRLLKEINNCNRFLTAELNLLPHDAVILAIGQIAHRAVLSALQLKQSLYPFTHNKIWRFPNGIRMLDSYHCSRYNINTKRLTEQDFFGIVGKAKRLLKGKS